MKLNPGTKNFWIQIGNILFAAIVLVAIAFYFAGSNGVILALFIGTGLLVSFLMATKTAIVSGLPDTWDITSTTFTDFPNLDRTWLEQQTDQLTALGFQILMDYKLVNSSVSGFARCFSHPQHYCFLEMGQCFPATGGVIYNSSMMSYFDADWTLASVGREITINDSFPRLWRHPHSVVLFRKADDRNNDPGQLLQSHLQFREQMTADLGITLCRDISWDAYQKLEQQAAIERKKRLQQCNLLLGMIEVTLFELNPQSEWLGDYGKIRQKRRSQR